MQFNTNKQRRQFSLSSKVENNAWDPFSVQFYKKPPTEKITLEEFENLALERLGILRLVERAGAKLNKSSNEYREMIINELKKLNLHHYYKKTDEDPHEEKMVEKYRQERRRDHVSHFILQLGYCRREDLRRWFIAQEVDLFRFRFSSETSNLKSKFMEFNDLNYNEINEDEKKRLREKLYLGYNHSINKAMNAKFYKVPFTEVLDLIRTRKVYIEKGSAYIPEDDLIVTVVSAYRENISRALAITSRALPQLEEDSRLLSILSTLHQRYIGTDYSNKKATFSGEIAPDQIDNLSKVSFPLCMRNLHETLRKNHHLKYNGRLQYGLFLKGIGLSLEDALRFWREEFTKVMDSDKFDKQYTYNIRYNYGKEGKRANFSPYSCVKIITSNTPGAGEHHGCPFKHSDKNHLKQRLQSLQISNDGINTILDLSSRGHYQIACTRFFEVSHQETSVDQGISHPNQYFEESEKIRKGIKKERGPVKQPYSIPSSLPQSNSENSTSQKTDSCGTDEMVIDEMEDIEEFISCLSGIP